MEISLEGQTALVGGSSDGIGFAIAKVLAECGAQVVLMARNEKKLQSAMTKLAVDHGQSHSFIVTDFNNHLQHQQIMEAYFDDHQIDILVNNTNGPSAGDVFSKGTIDYQQAFELLFQNAVYTTNLALPSMRKKSYGRIINVSSMTVKEPSDALVLSNTMRTALVSWAKSLSNAVAKDGITVNSILTGFFDTERLNSLMRLQAERTGLEVEKVKELKIANIPVGRLGEPEEYASLVAFLASSYANFLTGTAIPLDGGASVGLI
ncbi:SDR family oxidoreductase [Sphingobacterium shayense]|uniref:SDR family oxidoreductase n=1 Tax=Sphingobacterium shayense TaxID=626343 RepID=UPI001557302F|nr:SDR family oxidoreductase [Sphingobacterium shayense]NQD69758.1 SDR family oxidoreductase [Sphingobacterium shayense]